MKILLAEDDDTLALVLCLLLENRGYHVDRVPNGLEALIALSNFKYDTIITDIQMPIINGIEVVFAIWFNKIDVNVIVCSGRESLKTHPVMRLNPKVKFSPKPFDMDELIRFLQSHE